MMKRLPWPGRLSTVRRPPIAAISDRASNAPTPKPPALVEANGWNRRLRTKSASIPQPLSMIAIGDLVVVAVDADDAPARRPGWRRSHSGADGRPPARARRRRRSTHVAGVAEQLHVVARGAARRSPRRASGAARPRPSRTSRASPLGAMRASRSFILPTELLSVATMSARNSGLSAWRSALRATRLNWLTRFLMSWRMKAKRRLKSSNRWALTSACWPCASASVDAACRPAVRSRSIILPVERATDNRARRARRARPAVPGGSAGCRPRRRARRARRRGWRAAASRAPSQPPRRASKSTIRPSCGDRAPEGGGALAAGAGAGLRAARPVPVGGGLERAALVARQQHAAGRVEHVGERLDDALAERRRVGPPARRACR